MMDNPADMTDALREYVVAVMNQDHVVCIQALRELESAKSYWLIRAEVRRAFAEDDGFDMAAIDAELAEMDARRLADMTDAELRAAWLRTEGEVGDPVADAIAAEMQRRNLDICLRAFGYQSLARIRTQREHRPMLSRYQRILDSGHPTTERFAEDLFISTPVEHQLDGVACQATWEHAPVEVREFFRARARRFMAGDMSVAPWVMG